MKRPMIRIAAAFAVTLSIAAGTAGPAMAHDNNHGRPATYELSGDDGGSTFEGIGVDRHQRTFYVSEVTGGALWSFDLSPGEPARVDTGDIDLTNADGLVLRGNRRIVVRNFSRMITTLRLDRDAENAQPPYQVVSLRLDGRAPRS